MLARDQGELLPVKWIQHSSGHRSVTSPAESLTQSLFADELIKHAKASLLPLNSTLERTDYLTGYHPGFVDYIAYGR
jgi:hypothetical protein